MAGEAIWNGKNGGGLMAVLTARQTHAAAPYWVFGPILAALLIYAFGFAGAGAAKGAAGIASGLAIWTLTEYVLHRFSFHSRSQHRLMKPFTSGLHAQHHQYPTSDKYVAAPMQLAVPVFALMTGVFYLVARDGALAALVGSGVAAGFMTYERVHYMTHCMSPKGRAGKYLKKHHMLHHFADHGNYFGVTSPLWDVVFRTLPRGRWQGRRRAA